MGEQEQLKPEVQRGLGAALTGSGGHCKDSAFTQVGIGPALTWVFMGHCAVNRQEGSQGETGEPV